MKHMHPFTSLYFYSKLIREFAKSRIIFKGTNLSMIIIDDFFQLVKFA